MIHFRALGIDLRVVRIDDLAVAAWLEPETEGLDPLFDRLRPAEK